MDRRNGGDPMAPPPRPPKTFPRVHRPRAPEPDTVTENSNTVRTSRMSNNLNSNISPATAPLTPLHSSSNSNLMSTQIVSTFSRRRLDVRQTQPTTQTSSSLASSTAPILSPTSILNSSPSLGSRTPSPTTNNSNNIINNNVTLQVPRPENERLPNEYVDTPFTNNKTTVTLPRHQHSSTTPSILTTPSLPNRNQHNSHLNTNISTIDGISVVNNEKIILPNRTNNINSSSNNSSLHRPTLLPITKQPSFNNRKSSNTLCKKEQLQHQFSHCQDDVAIHGSNLNHSNNLNNNNNSSNVIINSTSDQLNSITCPQCSRCRCEECLRPRQLPSRWICNNYCYCSPETIIDYTSCLCCVKGLYYHCSNHEMECENDSISCADDPCSCLPYKRTARWSCLGALSLILPCLLCYWPMRGCVSLCAKCYANHSRHGCRCNNSSSTLTNNNRLNIINMSNNQQTQQPTNHHRRSNNNDLTPEKRLLDSSSNEY